MIYNIFGNLSRITKDELDSAYLPKHNGRYMIEDNNEYTSSFTVEIISTPSYAKQVYTKVKENETVQYYRIWYNNTWSDYIYNITREFNENKEYEGIPSKPQVRTIIESNIEGNKYNDRPLRDAINRKARNDELRNKLRLDINNEYNPNNVLTFDAITIRHDLHLKDPNNGTREYSINLDEVPRFLRIFGGRGRAVFGHIWNAKSFICTGNDPTVYAETFQTNMENTIRYDYFYYKDRRNWRAHYNFPFDPGDRSANSGDDPNWKRNIVNNGLGTYTEPSNGGGFRAPDDARDIIVQQYENTNNEISSCPIYFSVHGPSYSIRGAHYRTLRDEFNARYIAEEKRLIRDYGFSHWSQDVVWVKVYYR